MPNFFSRETALSPLSIDNVWSQETHLALGDAGAGLAASAHWHHFKSTNSLMAAATMIRCGNVVLPFVGRRGFKVLGTLVGDLRSLGNDGLRVIVREQDQTLRLAEVRALMRLGVCVILPKALVLADARQKLLSLEGTRYRNDFRSDVEIVLRQACPELSSRRMVSEDFVAFAHSVVALENNALPNTLIVIHPLTSREAREIDALLSKGFRDGAYVVRPEGIWLLLLACKPFDCQGVLERLLGSQFESLLVGWRKIGKSADILRTIDHMHDELDLVDMN
jgi:hypothetical protein